MKVGLIGNPNVGKSTIFNALTGMHQHTGNWPGKTVEKASGYRLYNGIRFEFEDLPGVYSLNPHSMEEVVTRDYVYFGCYDALLIVCDATALERNLNLVIQVLEITNRVIILVNLMDEAEKKGIEIDFNKFSDLLGVTVVPTIARSKKGIFEILDKLSDVNFFENDFKLNYDFLEDDLSKINYLVPKTHIDKRIVSLHLLLSDINFLRTFDHMLNTNLMDDIKVKNKVDEVIHNLYKRSITRDDIQLLISECVASLSEEICRKVIKYNKSSYDKNDRLVDKFLTGKVTGFIVMLFLLFLVLWITIIGANYPSEALYNLFFKFEGYLLKLLNFFHVPSIIVNALVYGVYRVLSWVISVMLPPMAIFFPFFTLLEDVGYLPRVAFNLDNVFKKCSSCGKQALTMLEGFGCNAVGVMGARIIDSPRERLLAILTNSFVPCNGRFPLLISLISMFLITNTLFGSFVLTLFILLGIFITFVISKILSKMLLKGEISSFILEFPPYRKPQIIKVIVRSIFDRTLFVLKRAIVISAPAGLIIWLFSNTYIGGLSLLKIFSNFLDPLGHLLGMDGVILMSFILGFPANEIVIPIMIMGYMSLGYIDNVSSILELKSLFLSNGWSSLTAVCVMIFSIFHFPCMTTLLTIKKETNSNKWTLLSFFIPLLVGFIICFVVNLVGFFIFHM